MRLPLVALAGIVLVGCTPRGGEPAPLAAPATLERAYGEPSGGFPTWYERMIHVLVNRARADPVTDLATCSSCADASCFTEPVQPVEWEYDLNRSARFHAANLTASSCGMMHNSPCQLVANIATLYPASCDGAPSCACQGGTASCSGGSTWSERLALFGASGWNAENIAGNGDPFSIFYQWLHETTADPTCAWSQSNGHRWNILGSGYGFLGVGGEGGYTVQDFGTGTPTQKILAGAHYPETGTSLEFRASFYDLAAPQLAVVNVDGACHALTVERGSATHGTYLYTGAVATGCRRYLFVFRTAAGVRTYYPTTGSFGIACTDDWNAARPAEGAGCDCTSSCAGKECGDNGCGGSCGDCDGDEVCQAGTCVTPPPDAGVDSGLPPSDGGSADGATDARPRLDSGSTGDASPGSGGSAQGGCACGAARADAGGPLGLLLALGLLARRRRRSRPRP